MAFADTGWIELRPITLFFGRNSSGKSAIIRALRLLRQSLSEDLDNPDYATLKFSDEYGVDLGNYEDAVHGGKDHKNRVMRFHFRCSIPEASDIIRKGINLWRQKNNLDEIIASDDDTLSLALGFEHNSHHQATLISIELSSDWQISDKASNSINNKTLLFAQLLDQETSNEVGFENWWLDTDLPNWFHRQWKSTSFSFSKSFLPLIIGQPLEELGTVFSNLDNSITSFLNGIEYIGPIRPEPQRVYMLDEIQRQRWKDEGWDAFVDLLEGNLDDAKSKQLDKWLKALNLGQEIIEPVKKYPNPSTSDYDAIVAKIELQETIKINLKNTGYGVSQVIPIIIQSITARQRVKKEKPRIVIIEQPELHLHPAAQAELGDLFIENSLISNGPTFLLETHSEHLLLRIMRRMKNTFMDNLPEQIPSVTMHDVAVFVINRHPNQMYSQMHLMDIGPDGKLLEPWPGGFFEERYRERFAKEESEG